MINREARTLPFEFEGVSIGECVTDNGTPASLTCTFNDAIVGKVNVRGTGFLVMQAVKTNTESFLEFGMNGTAKSVPLPNDKPISESPGDTFTENKEFRKDASGPVLTDESITWYLSFGTDWLAAKGQMNFGQEQTLT